MLAGTGIDDLAISTWLEVKMTAYNDSMPAAACNTDTYVGFSPDEKSCSTAEPFRGMCRDFDGVMLDRVIRVFAAMDEHGGSRALGDLIAVINDVSSPMRVIMTMSKFGLIRFDGGKPFDANLLVHRVV